MSSQSLDATDQAGKNARDTEALDRIRLEMERHYQIIRTPAIDEWNKARLASEGNVLDYETWYAANRHKFIQLSDAS